MNKFDLGLPKFEDTLFSTEEQRQQARLEKVMKIPISEIHDFKQHPFHVRMDEDMVKLIDSVKENGVLMPALVRPDKNGGYEMVSGHRRKFALEQNGITEIDAIVRELDDDQATIIMVDINIQREHILPTERGFAYRMKLEAMKHQGKRNDLTSSQVGTKLKRADDMLAEQVGESRNQIQRFIRLTYLVKELRNMVDEIHEDGFTIALNPAYELSFLQIKEQNELVEVIKETLATPSLAQAQELKRKSQNEELSKDMMMDMLLADKPNQKEKISLKMEEINKYFPKSYTPNQKKEIILKLLGEWHKKREREHSR